MVRAIQDQNISLSDLNTLLVGIRSFMPVLASIHPYPTLIGGRGVAYGDEISWSRAVGSASYTDTINYLASKHSKKQLVNLQGSKLHLKVSWFSWLPICVAFFSGVVSKP
jgi:hypothetical protein